MCKANGIAIYNLHLVMVRKKAYANDKCIKYDIILKCSSHERRAKISAPNKKLYCPVCHFVI